MCSEDECKDWMQVLQHQSLYGYFYGEAMETPYQASSFFQSPPPPKKKNFFK